jgi:hypothetical protein
VTPCRLDPPAPALVALTGWALEGSQPFKRENRGVNEIELRVKFNQDLIQIHGISFRESRA